MRTADQIVVAAMQRVDGNPLIEFLSEDRAKFSIVTRHYFGLGDLYEGSAPYPQVLGDSQMEDACARFYQRSLYIPDNTTPKLTMVYARLMWLCAIENVACVIYLAATTKEPAGHPYHGAVWATAFDVARIYTSVYEARLDEWSRTTWPIKPHMRRGSDAISAWVAAGREQSEDPPRLVAALEATDNLRNALLYNAARGRFVSKATNP